MSGLNCYWIMIYIYEWLLYDSCHTSVWFTDEIATPYLTTYCILIISLIICIISITQARLYAWKETLLQIHLFHFLFFFLGGYIHRLHTMHVSSQRQAFVIVYNSSFSIINYVTYIYRILLVLIINNIYGIHSCMQHIYI